MGYRNGAQALIFTSADVELEPTVDLLAHLHRGVADGDSPAEALRKARVELARQGIEDPYAYATVHANGLAHLPLFPTPPRGGPQDGKRALVVALAAGLLAIAGGGVWRARRRPTSA